MTSYPVTIRHTKKRYDDTPIAWSYVNADPSFHPIPPDPGPVGSFVPFMLGGNARPSSGSWPVHLDILQEAAGPPPTTVGLITNLFDAVVFYYDPAELTIDGGTVHATENSDGTGAGYDLPAQSGVTSPLTDSLTIWGQQGGPDVGYLSLTVSNPTDRTLYIQSATGTIMRWVLIPIIDTVVTGNPTNVLPPGVTGNTLLEKANPGFVGDLTRHEIYDDLVNVFLGQKVRITAESVGMYLGFVGRGHMITMTHFHWSALGGDSPRKTFDSTFRVEKIPNTLLPGTGTSTPEQDAAGTGAEVSMTLHFDDPTSGFGMGNFAPG